MSRRSRKPEILPAAAGLAEANGLTSVTHRALSARLDLGMTALFNHYPTRAALDDALRAHVMAHPSRYPRAHIEAKLDALKDAELDAFVDAVMGALERCKRD